MRKRTGHIGMSEEDRLARRTSLGGSDARIIMSGDPKAIERLWLEKRGEIEAENLDHVIIVQLGNLTEDFNLDIFEQETGFHVTDEQLKARHPDLPFIHSTLDGLVRVLPNDELMAVVEAKFMLPFHFTPEKALEKYWPQVQHNMLVTGMEKSFLSILTGGGQHVRIPVDADIFYQVELLEAEKDFWDCVQTGRRPGTVEVTTAPPPIDEMRIVDLSTDNAWVDLAITLLETKPQVEKHERAEKEIKKLIPDDAKEAFGRGVKISRSKDNKLRLTLDKKAILVASKAAEERQQLLAA